jgi:adenine-specific DNA-methyltransferase
MQKFDAASHDMTADRLHQLREVYPEAFTEQGVDFDRLKELLGEAIETGPERYSFTWPGKTDAIRAAQESSMGTLVPDKQSSVDWDTTKNLYLEGDNLEILKLLQKSYTGKVKMIYIDPPYNTGGDFVYPDKYGEGLKT